MKNITFTKLVGRVLKFRCIHKAIADLDSTEDDFCIALPFKKNKLYILQSRREVGKVLTSKTTLGFVNNNYNISHGHFQTINCFDTDSQLWRDIHKELYNVIQDNSILPVMEKYSHMLKEPKECELVSLIENFFLPVWAEYTFGEGVDIEEFKDIRNQLLDYIRLTFHNNKFNRVPYIGCIVSKLMYILFSSRIKRVDKMVLKLLKQSYKSGTGIFGKFWKIFKGKTNPQHAQTIALDNAVLSILVYDFIVAVEGYFWVKLSQDNRANKKELLKLSMNKGFLFPFRFRVMQEDNDYLKKGDFCIINLQKARLYFSFGPRQCVGMKLYMSVHNKMLDIWNVMIPLAVNKDAPIDLGNNKDLPFIMSKHNTIFKGDFYCNKDGESESSRQSE